MRRMSDLSYTNVRINGSITRKCKGADRGLRCVSDVSLQENVGGDEAE